MSEKLAHQSPEQSRPSAEAAEVSRKNIERIKALAAQEKQPTDNLEALQATIKQEALSQKELQPKEPTSQPKPVYGQKELKQQAFDRTMDKVRSELSPVERQLSKFVHQKTVDRISTVGAKTVARPSGILGGGIAACLGSSFILYYAKHLGFTYNYGVFVVLFFGGFLLGILVELVMRKFQKDS